MKFLNYKEDNRFRYSYLLILILLLLVSLDIYTTYLASPDLKLEANWLVRYFGFKWNQIIIYAAIIFITISIWLLLGLRIIWKYYSKKAETSERSFLSELFRSKKLLLGLFLIGCFYSHLAGSCFAVANNYLSYIYLFKIENLFSELSTAYINFEIAFGKPFLPVINSILIICAFIYSVFKIRRIGIRTRITQQTNRISEPVEISAEFVS